MILAHTLLTVVSMATCIKGFAQGTFEIGNIPAGDSIVIYYDVTINNNLPSNTQYISNQGLISGDNFANVVTDDPKTAAALDSTKTLVNAFPLPVTVTELKASQNNGAIEVAWKVNGEYNLYKYEVEKGADGSFFNNIGNVIASGRNNYLITDRQPFTGSNYYRLKMIDRDGRFKYSSIVKVVISNKGQSISLYPNPVYNSVFNLQLNNVPKGKYQLLIYSNSGQLVVTRNVDHADGSAGQTIQLPTTITKGIYSVKLKVGEMLFNQQLIVN
jgi:hypothetical protein